MHVAGYEFHVLNHAFTNHWRFQSLKSRPWWRARQQKENHQRFLNFSREIIVKYGRDPLKMEKRLKKVKVRKSKQQQQQQKSRLMMLKL